MVCFALPCICHGRIRLAGRRRLAEADNRADLRKRKRSPRGSGTRPARL